MSRAIFTQADLAAIRATAPSPCAKCGQGIAPGTLWRCDEKGQPVHIGECPKHGPFAEARAERGMWP
jgi:hypothetical protein